jgi:hypothetical protein
MKTMKDYKNWLLESKSSDEKEYDLMKIQYNKVRDTINSVKTLDQWKSAKTMLTNLSNWWVSDRPLIKPFTFKTINEPVERIGELEQLLLKKKEELSK